MMDIDAHATQQDLAEALCEAELKNPCGLMHLYRQAAMVAMRHGDTAAGLVYATLAQAAGVEWLVFEAGEIRDRMPISWEQQLAELDNDNN